MRLEHQLSKLTKIIMIKNNILICKISLSIFLTSIFFSCEGGNTAQYEKVKKERDSLLNIVKEINNKYVFDNP